VRIQIIDNEENRLKEKHKHIISRS